MCELMWKSRVVKYGKISWSVSERVGVPLEKGGGCLRRPVDAAGPRRPIGRIGEAVRSREYRGDRRINFGGARWRGKL